jgi:hypothetical protein
MNKTWIFGLLAILLIGSVAAENCFTAVSVPQSNKLYWKAITYTELEDGKYVDYLDRPDVPSDQLTLGPGYQYQMRLDKDCFDGYVLSQLDVTGIESDQINLQARDDDYYTVNAIPNKVYTVSIQEDDAVSTKLVSQVSTGVIDGVDYLALPASFSEQNKHPEFDAALAGVCQDNVKITTQLENIRLAAWKVLEPSSDALTCTKTNIIDCAISQGKADAELYAATVMAMARKCGVPTRIAHGISEGSFDGVDIYFPESKMHYWIEYYDGRWFNFEVVEAGASVPTSFESNCYDGLDNDENGEADCDDVRCVMEQGCAATVTAAKYDNEYSTDFDELPNLVDVDNLTLGNQYGSVSWIGQSLDLRNVNLDTAVSITQNKINILPTATVLDKPATATITASGKYERILKGADATCADCEALTTESPFLFTIPGTGLYSIEFANVTTNVTSPLVVAPPQEDKGLIQKTIDWVNKTWGRLTKLGKIVLGVLVVAIIYLWWRRRQRQKYRFGRP